MRGATMPDWGGVGIYSKFQSTRPMRGATLGEFERPYECNISIHAPHAGRDV